MYPVTLIHLFSSFVVLCDVLCMYVCECAHLKKEKQKKKLLKISEVYCSIFECAAQNLHAI